MLPETKQRLYAFADGFINAKSYRLYSNFFTVEELLEKIGAEFTLPFGFQFIHDGHTFMQATHWSSELGHTIIIDIDWYLPFENTHAFIDALEKTWVETERVKLLLEQIKV